jgi:Rrf2 family transcriptional regulator, iron-sulfur cluster assembly transcription factor
MRLTRAGEYGVRCVIFLSQHGIDRIVSRKDVVRIMKIPNPFLGKIAQQLARAGIIEILQGARGGYRLLIPPEELTLLDVVEAVIGEIFLNDCVLRPNSCQRNGSCSVHRIWEQARDQLRSTLRQNTFANILAEENCTTGLLENTGLEKYGFATEPLNVE